MTSFISDDRVSTSGSAWGFSSEPADKWKAGALCAQTDPEVFYPEKGGSTREAKRVCIGCPVRAECLDAAMKADERYGVWGGYSERQRHKLKRGPKA